MQVNASTQYTVNPPTIWPFSITLCCFQWFCQPALWYHVLKTFTQLIVQSQHSYRLTISWLIASTFTILKSEFYLHIFLSCFRGFSSRLGLPECVISSTSLSSCSQRALSSWLGRCCLVPSFPILFNISMFCVRGRKKKRLICTLKKKTMKINWPTHHGAHANFLNKK